jgi:hypothetical protein
VRSWSKLKIDRASSLDLGLKGVKLVRNVTKVGVRTCLPTGHPNLCSIFNSEKLVKVETRPYVFARVGLEGGENSSEHHESWRVHLSTNGTSETRSCVFSRVGLKWDENSSERHESWRVHLSTNGTSKSILKFEFREVGQS